MEKSAPVTLPVLSLASSSARSATSFGPGEASGDRVGCRVCRDVAWLTPALWATV